MYEIIKNIYVGSEDDYLNFAKYDDSMNVIHAKTEPYYSMAVYAVGERKTSLRGFHYCYYNGELCLDYEFLDNIIPVYDEMFNETYLYIKRSLENNMEVLIHCNQAVSRSPSIVFYYLIRIHYFDGTFLEAIKDFYKLYPSFTPTKSMVQFLEYAYEKYVTNGGK